jgi:hypothetical protein
MAFPGRLNGFERWQEAATLGHGVLSRRTVTLPNRRTLELVYAHSN